MCIKDTLILMSMAMVILLGGGAMRTSYASADFAFMDMILSQPSDVQELLELSQGMINSGANYTELKQQVNEPPRKNSAKKKRPSRKKVNSTDRVLTPATVKSPAGFNNKQHPPAKKKPSPAALSNVQAKCRLLQLGLGSLKTLEDDISRRQHTKLNAEFQASGCQ